LPRPRGPRAHPIAIRDRTTGHGIQLFAERALQDELDGGRYQDQAAGVIDAIADAKGLP
jgi:hypothetical protein